MTFLPPSLTLTSIAFICLDFGASACDLIPERNPNRSCFELKSTPFISSASSLFGPYIEGASVNPSGNIFAVNYGKPTSQNQLGQVFPKQRLFYADELQTSLLNGIRFMNASVAYVADAVNHRVLQLKLTSQGGDTVVTSSSHFCGNQQMLQPNDLALSLKTGTIFTSGMRSSGNTDNTDGDIWACLPNGQINKLEVMGKTNGIDLSPDENILYVSESYARAGVNYIQKIWKYNTNLQYGLIRGKTLFVDFAVIDGSVQASIDGMRTDIRGYLFVTRYTGSQVAVFSPAGQLVGKINLNFPNPTNLEFGGPTGTTLFVVGKCSDNENKGCVDTIEVAYPGRAWSLLQQNHHQGTHSGLL